MFVGSNPAEGDGLLSAIRIRNTPSFGGEIKPQAPFRKSSQHVEILYEYETDISLTNSFIFFAHFLLICYYMALLVILQAYALLDESGFCC
jgi:hypothetical protein